MKKCLLLFIVIPMLSWGQSPPTLYEVMNITVTPGHESDFEAAVKAHNAAFHATGAHAAVTFSNINGASGGTYSWIMGPMKWADQDSRPSGDAHDSDWEKVIAHVDSADPPEYWNGSTALSQIVPNSPDGKQVVWVYDLKSGKEGQWAELVGKVKKVYAEKRPTETYLVGWNAFSNNKGQDAVMIFPFADWAFMDDQRDFSKEFEAVHGNGSWHIFLNQINECVKSRVDGLRVIVD